MTRDCSSENRRSTRYIMTILCAEAADNEQRNLNASYFLHDARLACDVIPKTSPCFLVINGV